MTAVPKAGRTLPLSLLVSRILTDNKHHAAATDDLALVTDALDARANLHHLSRKNDRASREQDFDRKNASIGSLGAEPQGGGAVRREKIATQPHRHLGPLTWPPAQIRPLRGQR